MLQRALSENYNVEFRDYGVIEIPKGTVVDYKGTDDPHIICYPVSEFHWMDEKYPEQSEKMKADAIKHSILVPKDKLMLALRLRFIYDENGSCRDIYKDIHDNKKYCRMESHIKDKVEWYTVTDEWEEPDCPLRCDMLIQLADTEDKVVITEQQVKIGDENALEKILPFSWETPSTEEQEGLMHLIYNL